MEWREREREREEIISVMLILKRRRKKERRERDAEIVRSSHAIHHKMLNTYATLPGLKTLKGGREAIVLPPCISNYTGEDDNFILCHRELGKKLIPNVALSFTFTKHHLMTRNIKCCFGLIR